MSSDKPGIPARQRGRPPKYSAALRGTALELMKDPERTLTSISRELRIPRATLDAWVKKYGNAA